MSAGKARRHVLLLSLGTTALFAILLILFPLTGLVTPEESFSLVQIIVPVFAGYLGSAVPFLFRTGPSTRVRDAQMLLILIYGPFGLFWAIGATLSFYFWASNQAGGVTGMGIADLTSYLTLLVAFMNGTVGAVVSYLFKVEAGTGSAQRSEA